MVVDGWMVDWPKHHIKTGNDVAGSVVVYVQMCSEESNAAWDIEETKTQAARHKGEPLRQDADAVSKAGGERPLSLSEGLSLTKEKGK